MKFKIPQIILSIALLAISSSTSVFALDTNFYSSNDILFYSPTATCVQTASTNGINNKDYANQTILTSTDLDAINANMSFYTTAANSANIPWQLLAAVHYRETHLKNYGPSNGDGPFQVSSGGYPVGDYNATMFQDAANKAAKILSDKANNRDLTNIDNVKATLFAYNGASSALVQQALNLGFSQDQANNGEGSPYVMNRADLKRDPTSQPTKSNNTWGQAVSDGGGLVYPADSNYGAFVIYAVLSGINISGTCGTDGLISGGMTLDQARAFMTTYKTSSDSINFIGGASQGCSDGPLANCVSFSVYFINKYTTLSGFGSGSAPGDGISIANNIVSRNDGLASGTQPRPYAIFSAPGSSSAGHTGVVLGVDTTKNTIIIGEASCGDSLSWVDAHQYNLSQFNDGKHFYAYTDGYQKSL